MPVPRRSLFAGFHQPLARILPHRLQQPVADRPLPQLRQHQRLLFQRAQQIENIGVRCWVLGVRC